MWNLERANKEQYNCVQFLISTIAKHFSVDYRLMMLELWGFSYKLSEQSCIGDKLSLCWNGKLAERNELLGYHNFGFELIDKDCDNLSQLIDNLLIDSPVAVYIDSFVVPWAPFYQRIHRAHALFILDRVTDQYIVLDQYTTQEKVYKSDVAFVLSNAQDIVVFKRCTYGVGNFDLRHFIDRYAKRWEKECFAQLEAFAWDMSNALDLDKEIGEDPVSSRLIAYLKNLADDHENLIEAVNLLQEVFQCNLANVNENLTFISTKYRKIRAHLIKCGFAKKGANTDLIGSELNQIINAEHEIYKQLVRLL